MRRKILSTCLAIIMLLTMVPVPVYAASDEAVAAADTLHDLDLFSGTGTDAKGRPIYDLDRVPTRNEAVTMLVRLLGKEAEAQAGTWETPFTDVAQWAKPYVGYAYANGLTAGTSSTTYGGDSPITASQYLTFVLRALNYKDDSDFQWDKAWVLSDKIGVTSGQYNEGTTTFNRGDVAIISCHALSCTLKNESKTLVRDLYDNGAISYWRISDAGLGIASGLQTIDTPKNIRTDTENGVDFLVWDAPSQEVTVYQVYISVNKDTNFDVYYPQDGDRPYVPLNGTGLYELNENTTYYFKVRACFFDDTHNLDYFSAYTEPFAYYYSGSSQSANAPESVISELLLLLNRATSLEQSALLSSKFAYEATSPTYGVTYAKQAQSAFEQITERLNKAIDLCSQYGNLKEVKNDLLYIYNLESQYLNTVITATN